jgi:hypothetical protein
VIEGTVGSALISIRIRIQDSRKRGSGSRIHINADPDQGFDLNADPDTDPGAKPKRIHAFPNFKQALPSHLKLD